MRPMTLPSVPVLGIQTRVGHRGLFRPSVRILGSLGLALLPIAAEASNPSASASLEYLRRVQDQFHDRIPVYEDVSSAGNRFHAYAKIPDENAAVSINGSWTVSPRRGATALRCEFLDIPGDNFGGFYLLNGVLQGSDTSPRPNFGEVPNAGVDLSGTVRLTFWARGEKGGEQIEFFLAGVGRGDPPMPFPDASQRHPPQETRTTLSANWQQYSIEGLSALNLSYVLGGFGWVASDAFNPGGAVFYLDDIEYELSPPARAARLEEPRFLASYTTLPLQPAPEDCADHAGIDLGLRNLAFSYDNAVALLAFLFDGTPDSLRRARLIGDAFVYAAAHDRFLANGSIRSAYAAGDLVLPPGWTPNGVVGAVILPGFFCEQPQMFFEVGQEALDVGNNAWVMIALLALYRATGEPSYLDAAIDIGQFIQGFQNNTGTYQGFQGGFQPFEVPGSPPRRPWASGEHNLDVFAAFTVLGELIGQPSWRAAAAHARTFVEALWDSGIGCYRAGSTDPNTLNVGAGMLPLDVQAWAVLALPGVLTTHPNLLTCPETFHSLTDGGFTGFDFNEDQDGVWFEGTAQMAAAYARTGALAPASLYRSELAQAQATPPYGDGFGIAAATIDGLTSGFGFEYFRRFHISVAAWNVFAQLGANPYYYQPPLAFADGFESGNTSNWSGAAP